jgi:FkbH-like protein
MSQVDTGTPAKSLRQKADRSIELERPAEAAAVLSEIWRLEAGSAAAAAFVVSRYERIRRALSLQPHRIAILRSFTVEPVIPLLRAAGFAAGLDFTVQVGDFNAYVQELVDVSSGLYSFAADTAILAVEGRDVTPRLYQGWADLSPAQAREEIGAVTGGFRGWIAAFRGYSQANLIVHSLALPDALSGGVLDAQVESSQAEALREINRDLCKASREYRGVYVLDYDGLTAREGRARWRDQRKWLTVRMPFGAEHLDKMAREWMRFLHPLSGKIAKAIAVDLDNTLWGGVVGEDGFHGIQVGGEYPGAAFRDVQRALLDLRQRGILLALCSKNNLAEAMEVLEKHPGMLLRPEHFAAMRVNWNEKDGNLREIAAELNIGIDAVAFVDDNPVEREQVRRAAPEVTVIELPDDPLGFARAIRDAPVFERLTLSAEDRQRGEAYGAQRERKKLESGAGAREDFYRSLEQEAEIGLVSAATLARVAQLTQKTNQFNLTTRRYTEQQIEQMAQSPDWRVYWIRVRDRFSDNGVVGAAILHRNEQVWEIDTFLLSCRVIGRTVETALLAYLIEEATAGGAKAIQGSFLPTKKNTPAKDFYASHGFRPAAGADQGTDWVLDLPQEVVRRPEWIRFTAQAEV